LLLIIALGFLLPLAQQLRLPVIAGRFLITFTTDLFAGSP